MTDETVNTAPEPEYTLPDALQEKLDNLPKSPGVYQFKNSHGKIIYIGKAKNLRNRVRSYFQKRDDRAMHLMLRTIRGIFPIRSCDYPLNDENVAAKKYTICLDYHIDKCMGPCEGLQSREEYNTIID